MIFLKTIFFLYIAWCIFWRISRKIIAILEIIKIKDEKVRQLYWAVQFGRKKKIDKLLKEGVDINYQIPITEEDPYKQRSTTTILAWLLIYHPQGSPLVKRMYVYLLEKGADPLIPTIKEIHHLPDRITMMQHVAGVYRTFYLKKALEIAKPDSKKMNMVENGSIPLKAALYGWNYKNFQILLDYGVYPKRGYYWKEEDGSISQEYDASVFVDLFEGMAIGLNGVYMWLQHGLDYMDKDMHSHPEMPYVLWYFEKEGVHLTRVINFDHGIDYTPKIIKFLKEKGINIKLKSWDKNEKYITKDGEMILHIKTKNGEWKPYSKTWQYFSNKYWYYNKTVTMIKTILIRCHVV